MLEGKRYMRGGLTLTLPVVCWEDKESTVANEAGSPGGQPPIIAQALEGE